jgi:hypothetical protein
MQNEYLRMTYTAVVTIDPIAKGKKRRTWMHAMALKLSSFHVELLASRRRINKGGFPTEQRFPFIIRRCRYTKKVWPESDALDARKQNLHHRTTIEAHN